MLIFLFIVILLLWDTCDNENFRIHEIERDTDYRIAERRHRELMELKKKQSKRKSTTRRRILRDDKGRFIAEELIVEGDEDD